MLHENKKTETAAAFDHVHGMYLKRLTAEQLSKAHCCTHLLPAACLHTWRSAIPAPPPPPPRLGGPLAKFVEPSNADVSAENDGSGFGSDSGSFFPLNQLILPAFPLKTKYPYRPTPGRGWGTAVPLLTPPPAIDCDNFVPRFFLYHVIYRVQTHSAFALQSRAHRRRRAHKR